MSEGNNLAAAILAAEASRQEHDIEGGAAFKPKDVKAELWKNFEYFLGRLSGGEKFVSRRIVDEAGAGDAHQQKL
jgi:hypothetical protein